MVLKSLLHGGSHHQRSPGIGIALPRMAEVIHLEDQGTYGNYNFDSWREIQFAAC